MTVNGESYDLERTNFAKRLCADDANLIECAEINASQSNEINDLINKVLDDNNFKVMYRKQVEQMSANGTVGAYIRIDNADILDDGTFINGEIIIEYCDTLNIVPLTVIHNQIIECAFTGHDIEDNKDIYTLIIFKIENGLYKCENYQFDENGRELVDRTQIVELSDVKPFAIMRTAENNNMKMKGYGYPKLWSAIPCLEIIDLVMTMWKRDLDKSDKIVLINEELCKRNEEGEVIPPTKEMKKIFVQVGSEKLPEEKAMYQEYNPTVRIDEIERSLELSLSMLSMSFGFGTKKYTFEQGRILTATEYVGDKQDSMQEINKQRDESIQYIKDIVRAIVYFYNINNQSNIMVDEIKVDFDDSYIEDKQAMAKRMREDAIAFESNTLKLWYLMKQYNLTEEEAQKIILEIEANFQDDGDGDEE